MSDGGQVDHYRAQLEALGRERGVGPAWLGALRREAFERFAELGFPTTKLEDWKYTNVAPVSKLAFERALAATVGREDIEHLAFPLYACSLYVFVNGRFARELSSSSTLAGRVEVRSLAELMGAESGRLEGRLAAQAEVKNHAFAALNTALFSDGAFVHTPAGADVAAPVHLVFLTLPGSAPAATHPRVLVVAEEGSRVAVIEDYVTLGSGRCLTNPVTELFVGPNASVDHVKLQRENDDGFHVASVQVQQERSSRYTSHAISLGAGISRNDLAVMLCGEGADCCLDGLFVGVGSQHVDNHTVVDHAVPHGTSRELYKGILGGRARGVFNGRITVRPGAQKTDARQSNPNLLLSDRAEVNTKPQLEIYADDVKCAHGSSIGQIDEDSLFYLRARGLDEPTARAVLTRAFASQITDGIRFEALREEICDLLLARLAGPGGESA